MPGKAVTQGTAAERKREAGRAPAAIRNLLFAGFTGLLAALACPPACADPLQWLQDELKHFRSYPRLERAQRLMRQGQLQEARKLLIEAQAIHPGSAEIARTFAELCIALDDTPCIQQQLGRLGDDPALQAELRRRWRARMQAAPPAGEEAEEKIKEESQELAGEPAQLPAVREVPPPAEIEPLPKASPQPAPASPREQPQASPEPEPEAEPTGVADDSGATAAIPPPETAPLIPSAADTAYAAMREKDYALALHHFNRALQEDPDSLQLHMDRIWAAYNLGHADIWLEDLDYTLGRIDEVKDPQTRYIFTSANRWAEKRLQASFALVPRLAGHSTAADSERIKTNSYTGFSIAEVGYRLFINGNPSRFVLPYARALTTLRDHSLSPQPDSLQRGLGVSVKPLLQQNLLLTLERRFASEQAGGDDWLLRGSYSLSRGAEWRYDENCWNYRNFYVDLAHFVDSDATYLTLEYQHGAQRRIAERLTAIPYWLAGATANNDNAEQQINSRVDTGVGVAMQYFAPSSRLWSYSTRHFLALEARGKIAGNSEDDFTVQVKYLFSY